jgi:hypothetical protein
MTELRQGKGDTLVKIKAIGSGYLNIDSRRIGYPITVRVDDEFLEFIAYSRYVDGVVARGPHNVLTFESWRNMPKGTSEQWRSQFDAMQARAMRAEELGIKLLDFVLRISASNPAHNASAGLAAQLLEDHGIEPREGFFHTQDAGLADARSKFYDATRPRPTG